MGRTACTEPQCLYKGALYLTSVPVQGCTLLYLSDCTRVHFSLPQCLYKGALYLTSVPVQECTLPYLSACTRVHFTLPQCLYKGALYRLLLLFGEIFTLSDSQKHNLFIPSHSEILPNIPSAQTMRLF
jgi:hypothetical protein